MSRYKNNNIWWILIATILIAIALVVASCATPKNVTETIEKNDSVGVNFYSEKDTIIIRDTVYINSTTVKDSESEEETTLHFGDGGGTFNVNTGEATNVTNATQKKSKREKELEKEVARWQRTAEQYKCSLDSARVVNAVFNSDTESVPVGMSKMERFFHTSGIVAWCVIAIGLIVVILWLLWKFKIFP